MDRMMRWGLAGWCAAVAALAGVASAVGIFARGDGTLITVTSVRGGAYEVAANGVYAYNAQRVVAEGIGWDVFTLFVAVPLMLVAVPFVARGSFRGKLFAAGIFAYFFYTYLEYAVTWAFGPLFLFHVALLAASFVGLAWLAGSLAHDGIADRFGSGFPRRSWMALSATMSLLLAFLWLGRIAGAVVSPAAADEALLGETTMTVQALDLGLVLPALVGGAWLAWRRSDVGYTLSAVLVVAFFALGSAITAMLLSAGLVQGAFEWPPIIIFATAAVLAAIVGLRMYQSLYGSEHLRISQAMPTHNRPAVAH